MNLTQKFKTKIVVNTLLYDIIDGKILNSPIYQHEF